VQVQNLIVELVEQLRMCVETTVAFGVIFCRVPGRRYVRPPVPTAVMERKKKSLEEQFWYVVLVCSSNDFCVNLLFFFLTKFCSALCSQGLLHAAKVDAKSVCVVGQQHFGHWLGHLQHKGGPIKAHCLAARECG
jgi:hypothetical protein